MDLCVFNDAATYGNYVSLMEKAFFFPRFSTTWLAPAVRHVARGLKKCQDRSSRFPNFIRSHLLAKIAARETAESEFAQVRFLSSLFSFRVPSETLQLRRASPTDDLEGFTPQLEKALIGVRIIDGQQFLVAKLTTRKNLASGCILRRPCLCQLAAREAANLRPPHAIWAAVRRRVGPGELLFQSITRRNFNRALKAVLARIGVPSADRYSPHGFRRGTSQELKETGSPWSVVATSGVWRPPASRGYLDMSKDVEQGVAQLLSVDFDSDSAEEEPAEA